MMAEPHAREPEAHESVAIEQAVETVVPAVHGVASTFRPLNVFFDVDYTLLMWDGSLRRHAEHAFRTLKEAGHTIYVWSGVGIRRRDMERVGLDPYVTDYYVKPLDNHHERLRFHGVPLVPDFVIDDHRSVVDAFGGYCISDAIRADDVELLTVLELIAEMASRPVEGAR